MGERTSEYSKDEQRVADFLFKNAGVGGGDDPIGFIIASAVFANHERNLYRSKLSTATKHLEDVLQGVGVSQARAFLKDFGNE